MDVGDADDDELGDAFHFFDFKDFLSYVPRGDEYFALIVAVNDAGGVLQHQPSTTKGGSG